MAGMDMEETSPLTCDDATSPLPSREELAALVPHPGAQANKYSRGRCVLFCGMERYGGAAVLCTRAAQRMGAGYTQVYTVPANVGLVRAKAPSAVVAAWSGAVLTHLPDAREGHPCAYVVGPGFDSADVDCRNVVLGVLRAEAPVVVDGGALDVLGVRQARAILDVRAHAGLTTVITPHEGEALRLAQALGLCTDSDHPRGAALARDLAAELGVVVCLKGPVTFIASADDAVLMNKGTAALAKAGTGDVLAGMVGALLAQGLSGRDAGILATTLHALAGRAAEERLTDVCVLPEDVIEAIPAAIRMLEQPDTLLQ